MMSRLLIGLSLCGLVVLVGCSGPSEAKKDNGGPSPGDEETVEERPAVSASLSRFETFDVGAYPTRPPEPSADVEHRVPSKLMQGRADKGTRQTVEGFRIQVFSARDQKAAQDFRERVRQWWEDTADDAPDDLFRDDPPPIIIQYSQPYYRVRIGAFPERDQAEDALEYLRDTYTGAFVAQSMVTVIQ